MVGRRRRRLLYWQRMWPFRRKKKLNKTKLVVGLVIGGAIAATVGKKIMDKHAERTQNDEEEDASA